MYLRSVLRCFLCQPMHLLPVDLALQAHAEWVASLDQIAPAHLQSLGPSEAA